MRATCLLSAITAYPAIVAAQETGGSWLDESKPASWNAPGASIPAAPKTQGAVDSRCREQARPAQLAEDKRVIEPGWELVGPYHGGWQVVVIRATAGYDGMCRPRQYQDFVFVQGTFAGTLSPRPMDSRTDGALGRVSLQNGRRLTAEYERLAASDALCCPSRTTTAVFDVANHVGPTVRPASSTTQPRSSGSSEISFGPLAVTRAMCPPGSLHDQIVKQWGNIRSYVIRDTHLFLALMADGGIYEFEPIATAK